ncbi:TetR/AcrR family transcriptional regulator [Xanthovirga aplysinae]|uniref:TetR/AcrR family transcriptional regulator n=1 Tax=Xanthovirga aplysinae TaxID=2529853 RepID=UPI0012BC6329|nr:TetR/AcrR family transcriptional regulator [Xanthovirga aplysinae]MTI31449.1 TetR/AcrR family transcriptional regulator [Xanthovirga aplysinae]
MGRHKKYIKEEVLRKAMKTFWDHGFENTSSRLLEKNLSVNQKTLYSDFGNKHDIFLQALDTYYDLNQSKILAPLIHSEGDLRDIQTFFENFIHEVKYGESPNGCLFANTTMEFGSSDRTILEKLDKYYELLQGCFVQLLQKAHDRGIISEELDIQKTANYLVGCTEGLTVIVKVKSKDFLSDYVEIIIKSLKK